MFVNIKTDRAAKTSEQPVDESNLEIWPRLLSISWLLSDCEGNIKYETKIDIRLEDSEGSALNNKSYLSIEDALEIFYNFCGTNMIVVGHNINLIKKIIIAECYRLKEKLWYDDNEVFWYERLANYLKKDNTICTLESALSFYNERYSYRQETNSFSLKDLYNLLFKDSKNIKLDHAIAVYNCFQNLLDKEIINNPYSEIINKRNNGIFD